MAKFHQCVAIDDQGWCDWQFPLLKGYKMACCDCGLSHDMEFKIVKVLKYNDDGTHEIKELGKDYRVLMRAKRNNRSTGQLRRKKKCQSQ